MNVEFNDLNWSTSRVKKQYLAKVKKVLDRGDFILTPEVDRFEKSWAKVIGVKYCAGLSCGADALYLALVALGIGRGDEVITQGNAYNATVTAILRTSAAARFADIDPESFRLDISKIEPLINKKTKAILPVHLYGQVNDMTAVKSIARKYNLMVIEDCAQAHLAKFKGRMAGSWGDAATFSFYPTKNLGAFGDAGAVVTNNPRVHEKILALRNLGQNGKNIHVYLGYNMRLDALQAAVLNLKLPFLKKLTRMRQVAGAYYDRLIVKTGLPLVPARVGKNSTHVYHLYVAQSVNYDRDKLRQKLAGLGVQTAVHYPVPVYRQPFYRGPVDPCPVTEQTARRIISLPMFTDISRIEQRYVVGAIKKVIAGS